MFTTPVPVLSSSFQIDYHSKIMTMGSCFAENIGRKLQDVFFLNITNPFGVLYNPKSISESLRILLSDKEFNKSDLFQHGSLWNSFSHSSAFSSASSEETLQIINSKLTSARVFLREADVLMLTLGTSWVYVSKETGKVVSNCHKMPASNFIRERLHVEDIVADLSETFKLLEQSNPGVKIILTVSPIRHWKDGVHENTVSKSTLHLAVNMLCNQMTNISYFPAYEIMMDELRDYRFYASDMLHPSEVAIDYIWKRFSDSFFSESTLQLKSKLEQLRADLSHRPIHPGNFEYRKFIENVDKRKMELISQFPFLEWRL